ncbi:PREDICTED: uncharacterized hydrolase YNR064C isoform X3 [Lupinus angustifolius]|uniref:uncharacterized hydrolase YNR064C isoform X3 n=1 Tax=Lupinus angustifolius TaxID=3871 RepID=UPI00092E6F50|nr:PREDICTED: uncharacterized hydrolase YNR064C isoform X3 [Lupinus angustifolius]XP_019449459.1 PREDICTED: uncharacterized hydrolase YNR064C isoform X3 [Lupinus angustifolius]
MDSLSVEENIQMSLVQVMNGSNKGKWLEPIQLLALVKRLKIQYLDSLWVLVLKLPVIVSGLLIESYFVNMILYNRWFCVERGNADNPSVILVHGFPSQAYSYRKVLPILSKDYHAIAFDWLGFGFSDKPQPRYGFDYTLDEYVSSLESLINELAVSKVSLVVQGYFSPVVVKYASLHQEKINNLILLNPPLTARHAELPPTLSIFSNFLLGEIFSQDPLRASDKALTSCGPYKMKEEDAMVYRRPYLTSGSSGFALNALSRTMKKELKTYVKDMQSILRDKNWKVRTAICWGQRDRWLSYDGVQDFCKDSNHALIEVPMAGHHVQEDCGEEIGQLIYEIISRRK